MSDIRRVQVFIDPTTPTKSSVKTEDGKLITNIKKVSLIVSPFEIRAELDIAPKEIGDSSSLRTISVDAATDGDWISFYTYVPSHDIEVKE